MRGDATWSCMSHAHVAARVPPRGGVRGGGGTPPLGLPWSASDASPAPRTPRNHPRPASKRPPLHPSTQHLLFVSLCRSILCLCVASPLPPPPPPPPPPFLRGGIALERHQEKKTKVGAARRAVDSVLRSKRESELCEKRSAFSPLFKHARSHSKPSPALSLSLSFTSPPRRRGRQGGRPRQQLPQLALRLRDSAHGRRPGFRLRGRGGLALGRRGLQVGLDGRLGRGQEPAG